VRLRHQQIRINSKLLKPMFPMSLRGYFEQNPSFLPQMRMQASQAFVSSPPKCVFGLAAFQQQPTSSFFDAVLYMYYKCSSTDPTQQESRCSPLAVKIARGRGADRAPVKIVLQPVAALHGKQCKSAAGYGFWCFCFCVWCNVADERWWRI
jgi:hypothetical protein